MKSATSLTPPSTGLSGTQFSFSILNVLESLIAKDPKNITTLTNGPHEWHGNINNKVHVYEIFKSSFEFGAYSENTKKVRNAQATIHVHTMNVSRGESEKGLSAYK